MAQPASSVKDQMFEPESVQKALVNTIIIGEFPFSVVEQDEVKEIIETKFSGFQVPSSEMISRDCAQLFMDEKLKLKSFVKTTKQRVCLSLDTWKSNQSVNYLCITAHFIDENWKLHKKIIGFSPISSDNGEEIGRVVENCLHDWEISNVLAISAGNASSYDAAISYLGSRLANPVLDDKFLRLKCLVELTNTMVKGVLKDYDKPIAHVRAMVRCVKQSPDRIRKFKQRAKEYGIVFKSLFTLDCPSRWTSTFEMLYMAEKFETVFKWLEKEDPTYINELSNTCGVPVHVNWEKVRTVIYFLHVLFLSNKKILGLHVTSNMFLDQIARIDFHLDNWGKSSLDFLSGSKERFMKALDLAWNYSAYWGDVENSNMLIYIASILDPRQKTDCMEEYFLNRKYKHDYTDEGVPTWKKKAEWVVAAAYDLFNEYVGMTGAQHQTAKFQSSGYMSYLYHYTGPTGLFQKRVVGFGGNVGCKSEIDIYLDEDFDEYDGFDVLLWWKVNSERFPVLSRMAKDVLAIPISAVALESDINVGGNLLDDFRSSLSPSMVEAVVCTQDWINKSNKQIKGKKGSTKLADKILKGINEQLEGGMSGCG
ncbi:putative HAT dimerization domain, ribonuclease H-like superfamily, hAT-like transposase, RNase-H [Helianthus annuus]|nr:putative HAT dimerization domain, ribonuclease H-like superfamily, hAT-like transposase, RNase-H [Helianthus annuus]